MAISNTTFAIAAAPKPGFSRFGSTSSQLTTLAHGNQDEITLQDEEEEAVTNAVQLDPTSTTAKLIEKYCTHMKAGLKQLGIDVLTRIKPLTVDRANVILDFSRNNEKLGGAIRNFDNNLMRLTTVGLNGGTGVLRPLYQTESQFARENGVTVSSRLTCDKTRRKFEEFYPGYQKIKGGKTLQWSPPN